MVAITGEASQVELISSSEIDRASRRPPQPISPRDTFARAREAMMKPWLTRSRGFFLSNPHGASARSQHEHSMDNSYRLLRGSLPSSSPLEAMSLRASSSRQFWASSARRCHLPGPSARLVSSRRGCGSHRSDGWSRDSASGLGRSDSSAQRSLSTEFFRLDCHDYS